MPRIGKRITRVLESRDKFQPEFDSRARQDIVRRFDDGTESEYIGHTPTFDEANPEVEVIQQVIKEAMDSLTELERLCYESVIIDGKSRNAIARLYGKNVGSIVSGVDRAQIKMGTI